MDNRRGFTLIEVLVVIAIIAILMAVVRPMITKSSSHARAFKCESNLTKIGMAVYAYGQDYGAFPEDLERIDTILQDKTLLICPGTSDEYYYVPPTETTAQDAAMASCVDTANPPEFLPHSSGDSYFVLTRAGGIRKVKK